MMRPAALLTLIAGAKATGPAFVAVGDWGGHNDTDPTTDAQIEVAAAMASVASALSAESVLLLGDNFYSTGITTDAHSPRFNETFEQVYTEELFGATPFWAIAGNHDHKGNVSAQLAYHGLSPRWNYPSLYYGRDWHWTADTDTNPSPRAAEALFLDTPTLCGESDVWDPALEGGKGGWRGLTGAELPGPADPQAAEMQWQWLEEKLAASTADYLVVLGHYPIYSAGGDGTTPLLVAKLLPLLAKYGAHYMGGHDHMWEHLVAPAYPAVNMFLAGAGRECCYGTAHLSTVPDGAMRFMVSGDHGSGSSVPDDVPGKGSIRGGFASLEFGDDALQVTYYQQEGLTLYRAPPVPRRSTAVKHREVKPASGGVGRSAAALQAAAPTARLY